MHPQKEGHILILHNTSVAINKLFPGVCVYESARIWPCCNLGQDKVADFTGDLFAYPNGTGREGGAQFAAAYSEFGGRSLSEVHPVTVSGLIGTQCFMPNATPERESDGRVPCRDCNQRRGISVHDDDAQFRCAFSSSIANGFELDFAFCRRCSRPQWSVATIYKADITRYLVLATLQIVEPSSSPLIARLPCKRRCAAVTLHI